MTAFVLALVWAATGLQVRHEVQQRHAAARSEIAEVAHTFEVHAAQVQSTAVRVARYVATKYALDPGSLDLAALLPTTAALGMPYHTISIVGPDGRVMATSSDVPLDPLNLSSVPAFRAHGGDAQRRVFVGARRTGPVSALPSVLVSHRIDGRDGSFLGAVLVSVAPDFLAPAFLATQVESNVRRGVIALAGWDGTLHAAGSAAGIGPADIENAAALPVERAVRHMSGVFLADHRGVPHLWSVRPLERFGQVVLVGAPLDDLIGEAADEIGAYVFGASMTTIIAVFLAAAVIRGIRNQGRLLRELEQSIVRANEANELKSKFLASVSHELRTPLNGILGYAELIRMTGDAKTSGYGAIMHRSAEHLHSLVNTLLDLAQIEAGRLRVDLKDVSLSGLLNDAVRLNEITASAKGLELQLSIAPGCPERVITDRMRLSQVMHNLIGNAIKFSESGRITVLAERDVHGVVISVRDQGDGIAPERVKTLFERFHGADAPLAHRGQGAGLGLALSRELVELLGGSMEVESTIGVGTVFKVRLPLLMQQGMRGGGDG